MDSGGYLGEQRRGTILFTYATVYVIKFVMTYETVAEGLRRTFTITSGLREGYGPRSTTTHHPEDAHQAAGEWMKRCAQTGQVALSGFFTDTTILYVRDTGSGELEYGTEPAVRFWGEVSLTRLAGIPDEEIKSALNGLADALGDALGQEVVTVGYRDETWVRSRVVGD